MKRITSLLIVLFAVVMLTACAKQRDQAPTISGAQLNPVVQQGGTYNPLDGVTADDREDGNLTSQIVVSGFDQDDLNYAGTYVITLKVTDSAGNEAVVTINLTVEGTTQALPPVLNGIKAQQTYYIGSGDFNPIAGVTAIDPVDGNITASIQVTGTLLLDTPGQYTLTVRVTNQAGVRASASITVTVAVSDIPFQLTTDPIEITIWHAMGASNQALLEKYAASFKQKYPNVTVVIPAGVGNYDTLKTNMINAITANAMPNLVQAYPDHVAEYLNGKAVLNLNPYIESTTWGLNGADALDDIIQSYLDENSQYDANGTYYSLPFNKSTEVMIYNKTAFDALELPVPETWQDIIAAAPALKAYGDAIAEAKVRAANPGMTEMALAPLIEAAKALIIPASYDSTGNAFITFTRQFEGGYTALNYSTFKGEYLWVNNTNTTAAMQFLKDNKAVITLPEFWDQQYASTPFVNQQTFVTIGSSAGVRYNVPSSDPTTGEPVFQIGVAPVPYNADKPNAKAVIQQGTNISLMKTGTAQQQLASWLFLKHLISIENTTDWAMETGYLPVRTSAYESTTYQTFLTNPTANQLYISMAANAAYLQRNNMYYDPAFIGSSRARTQVGLALERIMLGDGNIAAALQDAYTEANLGGQ
ncbi:MAG: extracellular solute-binding protein [Acholeplasma sp.]|jgi:ABC-type glycerol-3-phosphate transport system substrate-binding protein|nr:extracellular solute-binding protein [Acholeplasma sp.]